MKTSSAQLARIPRFQVLSETVLEQVARHATLKPFGPGGRLVEQGAVPTAFLLIETGYLKWERSGIATTATLLDILGPCEAPGELALRRLGPHPASAVALTKGQLLELPRGVYLDLLTEPAFASKTSSCLGERAYSLFGRIETGGLPSVELRLGSFLYRMGLKFGEASGDGACRIPFPLSARSCLRHQLPTGNGLAHDQSLV